MDALFETLCLTHLFVINIIVIIAILTIIIHIHSIVPVISTIIIFGCQIFLLLAPINPNLTLKIQIFRP